MHNSGTTLHQGRDYATPARVSGLEREGLRYTKGGTTLHQGRDYATPRPLFSTGTLPYSSLGKVPVVCVAPNNKQLVFSYTREVFGCLAHASTLHSSQCVTSQLKSEGFHPSEGPSSTPPPSGTVRHRVAESRIGFLPPVHSPFGACTQLPTITMDPRAHPTPLIEVRGFATVFVLSNLNIDHQAWW